MLYPYVPKCSCEVISTVRGGVFGQAAVMARPAPYAQWQVAGDLSWSNHITSVRRGYQWLLVFWLLWAPETFYPFCLPLPCFPLGPQQILTPVSLTWDITPIEVRGAFEGNGSFCFIETVESGPWDTIGCNSESFSSCSQQTQERDAIPLIRLP